VVKQKKKQKQTHTHHIHYSANARTGAKPNSKKTVLCELHFPKR